MCLVLAVIGWPKVECERKATFGSKPNNFATLDAEIAISEVVQMLDIREHLYLQ